MILFCWVSLPRIAVRVKCLEANALIRAITQRILMRAFTWAVLTPQLAQIYVLTSSFSIRLNRT